MLRSAKSVVCAALVLGGCRERQPAGEAISIQDVVAPSERKSPVKVVYPAAPGSFVDLTRDLEPSIVHLRSSSKVTGGPRPRADGEVDEHALGTGFVVDRKGHILTNDHLVAAAPEITAVLSDGTSLPARVVGRDGKLDIALLVVEGPPALFDPAPLGDSDTLAVGEWVLALGNGLGAEVTASAGIVSSVGVTDRDAIVGPQRTAYHSFLEVDVRIDANNSGGPLVSTSGTVVGVNTATDHRSQRGGLAVPMSRARQVLPMLERDGVVTRAWLGVFVHPIPAELRAQMALETQAGALVSDVVEESPAARAGVRAGDVILSFDGQSVDHRNLPWIAATTGIGRTVAVTVWRNDRQIELQLITEKMPE